MALDDPHASMTLLWAYGMGMGTTAIVLAAAIAQRDVAEARHYAEAAGRQRVEREQVVAKERGRIMREMHDGVAGQLVSVLSMVQQGPVPVEEVAEGLRRTLDDMRIMIDCLDPEDLRFQELFGRLRGRLEPQLSRNGLTARWRISELEALDVLTPDQSLHVLRIIQEAVANVVQHSSASEIEIGVSSARDDAGAIVVEVCDNGVGDKSGTPLGGHGLKNMMARAEVLGAELRIESADPGRRVQLRLPVNKRR